MVLMRPYFVQMREAEEYVIIAADAMDDVRVWRDQ